MANAQIITNFNIRYMNVRWLKSDTGDDDGRDMGEMTGGIKGGMKNKESFILGASGPLTGGNGGFLKKNEYFQTSQRHLTTFSASATAMLTLSLRLSNSSHGGNKVFPPWEQMLWNLFWIHT